eukprot:SAG22_NODE_2795_length_2207_cov_1.948292_1_plen_110_part_00
MNQRDLLNREIGHKPKRKWNVSFGSNPFIPFNPIRLLLFGFLVRCHHVGGQTYRMLKRIHKNEKIVAAAIRGGPACDWEREELLIEKKFDKKITDPALTSLLFLKSRPR